MWQFLGENRINRLGLLVLVVVVLIGLVHLSYPFDGDQALFTIGASKINSGAILYRDFWDLKQPGIFIFYLIGGKLFGFTEVGIHSFELLYWAAFSVILLITLKNYYENPAIKSLVPLLTVGIYYGVSGSWHLTQAEGLVCFPLYLTLFFASEGAQQKGGWSWRLFVSGLMGGIVLLFKFLFLPVLFSFWVMTIIYVLAQKRGPYLRSLISIIAPTALGALLPLLVVFSYFAWHGTLGLLSYTFFEYPSRAIRELPSADIGRLLSGLRWFIGWAAPLMALGFIGAFASLRSRRELVTVNLALWFVLGLGVIVVQRLSWWEYHYMLLFVPLGILAAKGLDVLWGRIKESRTVPSSWKMRLAGGLSLALLFSPVLVSLGLKGLFLARQRFTFDKERRLNYQSQISTPYQKGLQEVAFLSEPGSLPGNIFICGNPVLYILSGRSQAIASNGWMLELFLPEQWTRMTEELRVTKPPYLFISAEYPEIIESRSPHTTRFIQENYQLLRKSDAGTWYILREKYQSGMHP